MPITIPLITVLQPLINPSDIGEYIYTVRVASILSKCFAEDKIRINVYQKLKFANAFTPNNDSTNETWKIEGISSYLNAEVAIYNRWGGEIFYSVGYKEEFAGQKDGATLPAGTYFYVIKPSPDVPVLTGYLTIVR